MEQKILFVGDRYPFGTNAGAILYQRIIKSYGIKNFCYYGVGNQTNLAWPEEFQEMPGKIVSLRIWRGSRLTKYFKRIPLIEELFYFLFLPVIIRDVKKFAENNNIKLVIGVFRADVLAIINKIDDQHRIPLLGYISDTVEAEYGDKPLIFRYKTKEYFKAIYHSRGIYVAGESMNTFIKSKFNKETSILRLGYESNFNIKRKVNIRCKEIKVFFSGSAYANKELELFVDTLSMFVKKHHEYSIILTTATTYSIKSNSEGIHIVNLGWVEERDLTKVMQDAHFGYVPYIFDKKCASQMTYAFPSKTGFYLSTGLPIFFHGPEYSSMSMFLEKYPCGIFCSSMDQSVIIAHLEKMIFDHEFYSQCLFAAVEAFINEFSLSVMAGNFRKLIDKSLQPNNY
jgi:glycosyltransferase involved in cell wall biosynthesis